MRRCAVSVGNPSTATHPRRNMSRTTREAKTRGPCPAAWIALSHWRDRPAPRGSRHGHHQSGLIEISPRPATRHARWPRRHSGTRHWRPFPASAAHDETNVMHLGEENVSADGAWATTFISNGALVVGGEGHAHGFEGGGDDIGVWGPVEHGHRGVRGELGWRRGHRRGRLHPEGPRGPSRGAGRDRHRSRRCAGVLAQSMTMETRGVDQCRLR